MSKFTFSAESPAKQKRRRAEIAQNRLFAEIEENIERIRRTDERIQDSGQRTGADEVRLIFSITLPSFYT
jgi:hypothetical protein